MINFLIQKFKCNVISLLLIVGFFILESKSYLINRHNNVPVRNQLLPEARLTEADWSSYNLIEPEGLAPYAFGYDIEDDQTGNTQFRQEERLPNGTVKGSYGYVEPDGNVHTVYYVADEYGYRARVENSRDNPIPPKATPRPGPTSLLNIPGQRVLQNVPISVVPNNFITPNVVAPSHLIPSSNLEVPIKNFDNNFITSFTGNGVDDARSRVQYPINPFGIRNNDATNLYFVNRN